MDLVEEVAPTEEVVKALLDYLVDPMLPLKASGKDPPLATQEAVAKQMHAVVLLYNYYQREQHPELQFLEFEAFCKLAVTLKPALVAHMKFMQQTDLTGTDDIECQLSVTEKAIRDACKISSALIVLKDISNTERWKVSKVSVLLIDSKKENCLLLFSSITNGAWSVIEKCIDISDLHLESPSEGKHTSKRKQMGKKALTGERSNEELAFRQVAFSAVEEASGINRSEVMVLERHVVYSLSEENRAAYFYIMQCPQSRNEDIQIPIKDAIESLQGPLLKRSSNTWILTPKIEYYNVLPYAQIISGWLSREGVSPCSQVLNLSSSQMTGKDFGKGAAENEKVDLNVLHNFSVELGNVNLNSSQRPENPCDREVEENSESIRENENYANSYSKEATGADNSNWTEKAVDVKDEADKCCDTTNINAKTLTNADPEALKMMSANELQMSPIFSSKRQKKDDVDGNQNDANYYSQEATGADNSNWMGKEVDVKDEADKCLDITSINAKTLSNADPVASRMMSANELQMGPNFSSKGQKKDDVDGGKNKNFSVPIKVYHHQKRKLSVESAGLSVAVARCKMETSDTIKSNGFELVDGKVAGNCIQGPVSSPLNEIQAEDCAIVPFESNAKDFETLQATLATKETAITETALRVLLQKREEMCHQQHVLEDKIASCSRDIQKIMDGNGDALALKLQAVIDGCSDVCLRSKTPIQGENHQDDEVQGTIQCSRRNRLTDAILSLQSPCQELDYICHVNNWRLPRYSVSATTGGFLANATIQEMDFDVSCEGALLSTPEAARDSAAALMITKLREMAGQA